MRPRRRSQARPSTADGTESLTEDQCPDADRRDDLDVEHDGGARGPDVSHRGESRARNARPVATPATPNSGQ